MRRMRINSACIALLGAIALAPSARAQWDSTTYDASQPVLSDDFVVTHTNATGVQAFSAATGIWTTIAPATATARERQSSARSLGVFR